MNIEEIVNYVITSPENTNANVLRDMLNQLNGDDTSSDAVDIG